MELNMINLLGIQILGFVRFIKELNENFFKLCFSTLIPSFIIVIYIYNFFNTKVSNYIVRLENTNFIYRF